MLAASRFDDPIMKTRVDVAFDDRFGAVKPVGGEVARHIVLGMGVSIEFKDLFHVVFYELQTPSRSGIIGVGQEPFPVASVDFRGSSEYFGSDQIPKILIHAFLSAETVSRPVVQGSLFSFGFSRSRKEHEEPD